MTRIATIVTRASDTLIGDALGVLALALFTYGLLQLPGLV